MRKIFALIYVGFMCAVIGLVVWMFSSCNIEETVQPKKEQIVSDNHYNSGRMKVVDGVGIIHWADSTKDTIIEGNWMKVIFNAGEQEFFPYDWNMKGFTTKK